MEHLGKIPELGEVVEIENYVIIVERMKGKRIITLRLLAHEKREEDDHGENDFSS